MVIVAVVGVSIAITIASLVCSYVFCFVCFVVIDMFGNSFVALMSYETVKLRFNDDFVGIFFEIVWSCVLG